MGRQAQLNEYEDEGFYPLPNHKPHKTLEYIVEITCQANNIVVLDVPHYANKEEDRWKWARNFSMESLYTRSMPDKFVLAPRPFYLDIKTTTNRRKDTGNVAIELSCFYFNLKRTLMGVRSYYCISDTGVARVFSPTNIKPHEIRVQSKWKTPEYSALNSMAEELSKKYKIKVIGKASAGSFDPFVLIKREKILQNSTALYDLIKM